MKIAIIGSGIAGNGAAWLLSQAHDITVYESAKRPGGHSHTVMLDGHPPVDCGFIVYNDRTYPNFIALMDHLGVESEKTDMSFGVSLNDGKVEYAGHELFAQGKNRVNPRFLLMLKDIKRFYEQAPAYLESREPNMSLGLYLKKNRYSSGFIHDHILPMAAAIWSAGVQDVRKFPARSFIRFFRNHGLLMLKNRPPWRTILGGSRQYVEQLTAPFRDKIRLDCEAISIYRRKNGVEITDKYGGINVFDSVVLACHADQSLRLLQDITPEEKEVLGAFPYTLNRAFLHQDKSLMPKSKSAWSSWNYLSSGEDKKVAVTYWMNKLQPFLGTERDYFVTLNPPYDPENPLKEIHYSHPVFTGTAMKAWKSIKTIQGVNRTWFCGAWCGYGFHEDGLASGLAVAESIGPAMRPWTVTESSPAAANVRP